MSKKSHVVLVSLRDLLDIFPASTRIPIPRTWFTALGIIIKESAPIIIEEKEPLEICVEPPNNEEFEPASAVSIS